MNPNDDSDRPDDAIGPSDDPYDALDPTGILGVPHHALRSNLLGILAVTVSLVGLVTVTASARLWTLSAVFELAAILIGLVARKKSKRQKSGGETAASVALILAGSSLVIVIVAALSSW